MDAPEAMREAARARVILRWTGVAAIVTCLVLVVLELLLPSLRAWWVERPLILGVVAGY
jgi:hypothetical protein